MSILIEKHFELTSEEQAFVDFLMGSDCPYFLQKAYNNSEEGNMFVWTHALMLRDDQKRPVEGVINSALYEHAYKIFKRFCDENNIKVSTVFRACVNASSHAPLKHSQIHLDHDSFEHNNFLLYMNEVGGNTYIFNEANDVTHEIVPAKNKVAVFTGRPHAQGFGKQGEYRFVIVFTFA